VIGDLSLVRALGRCGIPVAAAISAPRSPLPWSRYCEATLRTASFVDDPERAVADLSRWAKAQSEPPVAFYQGDHDLLALSRSRAALAPHLRCVLPAAALVEDLVDKLRFAALAARVLLPTPSTMTLKRSEAGASAAVWEEFPCVLKPAVRTRWFGSPLLEERGNQKAVFIRDRRGLERALPLVARHETDFILQAAIAGGEERVVSYHAYVRPGGEVVAEFTGKKVRTAPRTYGLSTCVEITDDAEVKRLGRSVLERIEFSGVVKIDFKRSSTDERLYLLEINPRFNLWHHPGALAGVSLPELVYQDCVEPGSARARGSVRCGVRWIAPREDLRALGEYRAAGAISRIGWLREVLAADINEDLCLRDPMPGLFELVGIVQRRLAKVLRGSADSSAPSAAE
jgi:predicted ATP-grasp superfamily ATP-dependent carboligase